LLWPTHLYLFERKYPDKKLVHQILSLYRQLYIIFRDFIYIERFIFFTFIVTYIRFIDTISLIDVSLSSNISSMLKVLYFLRTSVLFLLNFLFLFTLIELLLLLLLFNLVLTFKKFKFVFEFEFPELSLNYLNSFL